MKIYCTVQYAILIKSTASENDNAAAEKGDDFRRG